MTLTLKAANDADGTWAKVHKWRKGNERRELTDQEAESWRGARRASKTPVQRTRYLVDWNNKSKAEEWRAAMAEMENASLERAGEGARVDHRSYARRGVDVVPTVHEGPAVTMRERRAEQAAEDAGTAYEPVTERRRENERIRRSNEAFRRLVALLVERLRRLAAARARMMQQTRAAQRARGSPRKAPARARARRQPARGPARRGPQPGM